jgi:hypothetical protein
MNFDPLSAIFDVGKTVIEKIWPDPAEQARELRKLEKLRQDGDLAKLQAHVQLMTGQMQVNAKEAEHKSIFVAGWRPFIGWVGGFSLGYQFIFYPLLLWVWSIVSIFVEIPQGVGPPPVLDGNELYSIVLGMLGIGAMRSYDKKNGTATSSISK